MRKWKTILWIFVLSFLSVSCGNSNNPYLQTVGTNSYGTGVNPYAGYANNGSYYAPPTGTGSSYGTSAMPVLYAADGVYLGAVVSVSADPDSICNQAGEFGSPASPSSIWNYGTAYGNPASPLSAQNPAATTPPTVCYWDGYQVNNCVAFVSRNPNLGYATYNPDQLRATVCAGY